MRVKSARSIRKGASSGQTAASLVENHARKPPSSALIANHASKPALFDVPSSESWQGNGEFKVGKEGPSVGSQTKIFVPDYLRSNSYRVLQLSANSNYSEIHKASASMKRAAKLGLANATEADMPILGEISRTEADESRKQLSDWILMREELAPNRGGEIAVDRKIVPL